jgi:hypothetical protein
MRREERKIRDFPNYQNFSFHEMATGQDGKREIEKYSSRYHDYEFKPGQYYVENEEIWSNFGARQYKLKQKARHGGRQYRLQTKDGKAVDVSLNILLEQLK